MSTWTDQQWGAFTGVSVAGIAAVALLILGLRAVHTWTAPAPLRHISPSRDPRPTVTRAVDRVPSERLAAWSYDLTGELAVVDEDVAAHLLPGPGSLETLRRVEGSLNEDEAALHMPVLDDDDEARWSRMLEDFRVAVEPPLRTARLWLVQAGETGARAALSTWRMDTPTGEYPSPFAVTPRSVAAALLVS